MTIDIQVGAALSNMCSPQQPEELEVEELGNMCSPQQPEELAVEEADGPLWEEASKRQTGPIESVIEDWTQPDLKSPRASFYRWMADECVDLPFQVQDSSLSRFL